MGEGLMATLVGGIASSHAPSIAHAYDAGQADTPDWKRLFDAYKPVQAWLAQARVDVLVVFYNDHLNRFQLDAYPTFALGVAQTFPVADEGRGKRPLPDVPGHPAFAWHCARSLVRDEFDLTVCQEMELDHGVMSILPLVAQPPWPFAVLPVAVNVIQEPLPTPARCFKLGQAIGRAIRSCPQDLRVAVMSTGGMSHQLHGTSFGFTNPDWDQRFLDLLHERPEELATITHDELIERGGAESVEMMVWLAARGALHAWGGGLRQVQRYYWAPMLTGYGLIAWEASKEQAT
jgi:hypothetical protein